MDLDIFFERGCEHPVVYPFSCSIEGLIGEITQSGSKAKPQQGKQTKNKIGVSAGIRVMFFNFRCILIQQSIQDIRGLEHRAVDHIDPVLFAPVVDVVVERDPTAHPKKAPIVPGVQVGGCHPKANAIRRRGFPIAEKRREGKRSMIGNEMMDRRSQGFFAEIPIVCCFQFM